jgi:hypothetical protein
LSRHAPVSSRRLDAATEAGGVAGGKFWGHIGVMNLLNENYLWAQCIWGAIASGYMIYGWRQRAIVPFVGSLAMSAACLLSALWMSLACIAVMFVVWWLLRQGY